MSYYEKMEKLLQEMQKEETILIELLATYHQLGGFLSQKYKWRQENAEKGNGTGVHSFVRRRARLLDNLLSVVWLRKALFQVLQFFRKVLFPA